AQPTEKHVHSRKKDLSIPTWNRSSGSMMYLKSTCRNSGQRLMFINTPSDLKWTPERTPRVPGQSFAELPFEEEILEFLRFFGHSAEIKTLTDVNVNKLFQPWRSFAAVINKCLTGKSSGIDSLRNTKAYKEYYACATGKAAPKPKASARKKQSGFASSTTPPTPIATPTPTTTVMAAPRLSAATKGKQPAKATSHTDPSDVERTEAEQLKIVLRRSRQETHISQQRESDEGEDEATESDGESKDEETREQQEESFDPIPRTPEDSEDDGNNEEDQASQLPIPPTPIPSLDLQNLPTFASVFCFEDRVKSLEVNFSNIPADLSKMELKKILIEKMERNKSIQRSDEQRNLYKALVEAYDTDKTILESYEESTILKRRREEDDDQEGPSAGSDRGSKRQREGGEHASASTPSEPATESAGSDGTLNEVRNALDDRLKGIKMQYLPTTIWRKGDKDRAAAMIQAIDKMLKTRRIMRSLERFVGGRQYEGDFRMLQRTI
nr:hypothetical protein [Tanacetum cinerariifolium]